MSLFVFDFFFLNDEVARNFDLLVRMRLIHWVFFLKSPKWKNHHCFYHFQRLLGSFIGCDIFKIFARVYNFSSPWIKIMRRQKIKMNFIEQTDKKKWNKTLPTWQRDWKKNHILFSIRFLQSYRQLQVNNNTIEISFSLFSTTAR